MRVKMTDAPNKTLLAFKPFEHFCKAMLDAYFLLDADGKILKANPAAALLTGLSTKQLIKAASLDEVLTLKISEKSLTASMILENLSPTRLDDIKGETAQGSDLFITIGYFPFIEDDKIIGAFVLVRDVTAETQLQGKYKDKAAKSVTDQLTGLFNRAHFEEYMRVEEGRIENLPPNSDHRNMAIIMGDIDHFKKINDKYGHPAGDFVIKTVAQALTKTFRKTDIVCRYGGEEFLIILPASDLLGAKVAADKARATIESTNFEFAGVSIPVTISMGVAQLMVGQETSKETIARADAALYNSKQNGRNQVSMHTGAAIISATHNAA
jgi:diguanylate cyclase (GGDEF)-like protein/PAS domain S-box-containing protein